MQKKILVFSNGEKIGDGLIKLPLLNEIKRRLPEYKIVWMTNRGRTVYNNQLKNIAIKYIDQIIEKENNMKISDIFKKKGEIFFRKQEESITINCLKKNHSVIFTYYLSIFKRTKSRKT